MTGKVPFLVSGNIGAEDIEKIKGLSHPLFYGISVNEKFESAPAIKGRCITEGLS